MAEKFSWLTENTLEPVPTLATEDHRERRLRALKEKLFYHRRTLIVLGVLIFSLFLLKSLQRGEAAPLRIDAMAALVPIPKGAIIEGMLLRPVNIMPGTLSKAQKLQRLRPDDAEKIMGKLRAKKDIPPHRPILWNELELIPATRAVQRPLIPTITYPEN